MEMRLEREGADMQRKLRVRRDAARNQQVRRRRELLRDRIQSVLLQTEIAAGADAALSPRVAAARRVDACNGGAAKGPVAKEGGSP